MAFLPVVTTVPDRATVMNAMADYGVAQGIFTDSGTIDNIRRLTRGGIHWNFRTVSYVQNTVTIRSIEARMTYSLPDSDITYSTVPGQRSSTRMGFFTNNGPYTAYYLFQHNNCIHAVIEIIPNVFTHMSFGVINKVADASWTGGEYITASNLGEVPSSDPRNFTYVSQFNVYPFDGGYGRYLTFGGGNLPASNVGQFRRSIGANDLTDFAGIGIEIHDNQRCRMMTRRGMYQRLIEEYTPNDFNFRSPIFPCYVRLYDSVLLRERFAGTIPGVGYVNNRTISSKAIVDSNWQVFPIVAKTTTDSLIHPANIEEGLAYLRA